MPTPVPFDARRLLLQRPETDLAPVLQALSAALASAPGLPPQLDAAALAALTAARAADPGVPIDDHGLFFALRCHGVPAVRLALATLSQPLRSPDSAVGCRWVALVVTPRELPVQELRVHEQLCRLAADQAWRRWVDEADDPRALAPWLDARLREEWGPLTARDLMRPSFGRIAPETPLPALVRRMAHRGIEAVGVTDEAGRMIGQITASSLFTLGMPDFFHQLKSVSFIPDFDPFEAYFQREGGLTARDVMHDHFCVLPPEATIVELTFALTVQGYPKVYVVENNVLIGVIDRIRVLDRILSP